jgi:KAP family P-loop domain
LFRSNPSFFISEAIVIFVDDLDRCTPDTVRQVIDGINSFFTDNLPCIFVIAMDSLIVAAALEVAQNQIISRLPEDLTYSSLGRKFMDKFVQLPIMLPPFGETAIKKYVNSIVAPTHTEIMKETAGSDNNFLAKYSYTPEELSNAAYEFSNNPRDIKRFVNSLRFYPFLLQRFEQDCCNQDLPDKDQIKRWTMLSLRWPSVVRWLYWNPGGTLLYELNSTKETDPVRARLKLLEREAHDSNELLEWQNAIKKLMCIDNSTNPNMSSIADENLNYSSKGNMN